MANAARVVGLCLSGMLMLGGMTACSQPSVAAQAGSRDGERPLLDVPYVPTRTAVVEKMLEMGQVGANDYVIDLGSGDGRILVAAARDRDARGFGVDIDPERIAEAEANAKAAGVSDRVTFRRQDLFQTPIKEATVLTMYLLPEVNLKLRPRILSELRPGTRIVSHAFDMGDWEPDEKAEADGATVYHWIVPANIAGRWTLSGAGQPMTIDVKQTFQNVEGSISRPGGMAKVEGKLAGDIIRFNADLGDGAREHEGRVSGNTIAPTDSAARWRLTRAG